MFYHFYPLGKSQADGIGAILKQKVRDFINHGGAAVDPVSFSKALANKKNMNNVIILRGDLKNRKEKPTFTNTIKGIKSLYDFEFTPDGIRARKASRKGCGKMIDMKPIKTPVKFKCVIVDPDGETNVNRFTDTKHFLPKSIVPKPIRNHNDVEIIKLADDSDGQLKYPCRNIGCGAKFSNNADRIEHVKSNECFTTTKRKEDMLTFCRRKYFNMFSVECQEEDRQRVRTHLDKLEEDPLPEGFLPSDFEDDELEMGYALALPKERIILDKDQDNYLRMLFNQGQSQRGGKFSSERANELMKTAKGKNGKKLFPVEKYLEPKVIKRYFTKYAVELKYGTERNEEDLTPDGQFPDDILEEVESLVDNLSEDQNRENILNILQRDQDKPMTDHPLEVCNCL